MMCLYILNSIMIYWSNVCSQHVRNICAIRKLLDVDSVAALNGVRDGFGDKFCRTV